MGTDPAPARYARIHVGPGDAAGAGGALTLGLRACGETVQQCVYERAKFGMYSEDSLDLDNLPRWRRGFRMVSYSWRAGRGHEIFIFLAGTTLLPRHLDLPFLRRRGKRLAMVFTGSELREGQPAEAGGPVPAAGFDPARRRRMIRAVEKHVDVIVAHQHDAMMLKRGYYRYLYAIAEPPIRPQPPRNGSKIVVAHAPSNPSLKGTEHVTRAVTALKAKGFAVELDLISGVPHSESLRRTAAADIVVDQLLMGMYGGYAVEGMLMRKPVVAHVGEQFRAAYRDLPIVNARPDELERVMEALAADAGRRRELGEAGYAFAKRVHDPARVARRILSAMEAPRLPDGVVKE